MAKSIKEIWAEAKRDIQKENTKFASGMKANAERTKQQSLEIRDSGREKQKHINTEFTEGAKASKDKRKSNGATKNLMLLWGIVATFPLLLFGLFLLFIAGIMVWSMF